MDRSKIDSLLAPNADDRRVMKEQLDKWGYYAVIVMITLVSMILVPFISGSLLGDFKLYFPKTTEGWVVYWIIRGGMAFLNLAIFALFKMQAKVNVKHDKDFLKAKEILHKVKKEHKAKPRSPAAMEAQEWTKKGVTIFISTILAGATISSLILSFDIMTFLSALSGSLIGIGFGYVTMRKNEIYWTEEYLEYAEMIKQEEAKEEASEGEKTEC